jgi:hypothetical protein
MGKIVVPQKERKANKVDELFAEIKQIQRECKHDFRLLKSVGLKESKEKGFFIIYDASLPVDLHTGFIVKCLECSKEKECYPSKICPRCLSLMQPGGLHNREKYFGLPHSYYAARLYYCTNKDCGFRGVTDEWDQ